MEMTISSMLTEVPGQAGNVKPEAQSHTTSRWPDGVGAYSEAKATEELQMSI